MKDLRVWLVHDWLTGFRGGEKVLLELVRMFPRARVAALVHVRGASHPEIEERVERVSFLNRMPGVGRGWRNYLPLYPAAVRSLALDDACDLVISVSHAVAKGVRVPGRSLPPHRAAEGVGTTFGGTADGGVGTTLGGRVPHICYCLTPMRYIWGMEGQYLSGWSWKRGALALVRPGLRRFDVRNEGVTEFVTLSQAVAGRIEQRYGRESAVVYPGIEHGFYCPVGGDGPTGASAPLLGGGREDFYLMAGALVGYKRVDLGVRAFCDSGKRLVVIGSGPEEGRLRRLAKGARNVTFLGRRSDEEVREHYRRCRGFLFPGEEDFGLTVVEAQACGAGVIAYGAGGARETVVEGVTGVFFDRQTVEGVRAGVERFEGMRLEAKACRENAMRFTWEGFRAGMSAVVARVMHNVGNG